MNAHARMSILAHAHEHELSGRSAPEARAIRKPAR